MFKSLSLWFVVFGLVCTATNIQAQNSDPEDLFNRGLILYRNGDYEQAKINFITLVAQDKNNPKLSSGLLMLAKTFYNLGDSRKAELYANRLIQEFPTSDYLSFAYFVKGNLNYERGNFYQSLENFTYAIEFAPSSNFLHKCEEAASKLVSTHISTYNLENLAQSYPWTQAEPMVTIWQARLYAKDGDAEQARTVVENFLEDNPSQRYTTIAKSLLNNMPEQTADKLRIGIIQPISGFFSNEAKDFLRGMAFALSRNRPEFLDIELLLGDSGSSMVETVKSSRDLLQTNIEFVIGDLEGSKSAAIAGLLSPYNTPLIVPVSTENGITELGDYIFQINNDTERRGTALARHAIETLQMKTFATLAPADEYGNSLTDAFTNSVDQLGGTIISQQWYYPGSTDFSRQFQSIREAGFRLAIKDTLNSRGRDATFTKIDSMYSQLDRSARYESDENEGLAKFTDIPVHSIDGIFLPIYEEDVPYIASQLALFNIKAGLLGGDYWNDAEMLRKQQRYLNGIVFVAGLHFSETDIDYINFIRDFRIATSTTPGAMAVYGYNVMNLILEAIGQGHLTGIEIANYLKNVENYQGLGTTISFDEHNVNQFVNILQFIDGNIRQLNNVQ